MKIDALLAAAGKKADPKKKGQVPAAGFDALLSSSSPELRTGRTSPAPAPANEKKARAVTGTEEALLVSRTLAHSRPVPFIDTKLVSLKPEARPAAEAVAQAARGPVTLDHLATRAKAQHEQVRVTGPSEKKPARAESLQELAAEAPARDERKTEVLPTAQLATPPPAAEPFRLEAAGPAAAPLAPVAPLLLDDPAARVVILPHVARMSVDTGDGGQLNVQVKVRDGIAELTAAGPASQLLELRQGELRVALAKEGLALGHFDLTQSGQHHQPAERHDPDPAGAPQQRRGAQRSSTPDTVAEDGRVHVRA